MGTNFYVAADEPCATCGRSDESAHIGKSSAGWRFSLHVVHEWGLTDWPEWEAFLTERADSIRDEYGNRISLDELKGRILHRKRFGPEGRPLLSHADIDDSRCLGKGRHGTYDLIVGEFS